MNNPKVANATAALQSAQPRAAANRVGVHGDTLYGCSALNHMFALDAATGIEKWSYDPGVDTSQDMLVNCRGVSSWQAREPSGQACDHRILMGTLDARLIALDAQTGKPCEDFGERGQVDLSAGLGRFSPQDYSVTSPPAILDDLVITGAMVLDRTHDHMPSGVVRAFDVRSGKLAWYWDAIPPDTQHEFDAQGKPVYHRGTTNVWSIISVDPARKLVFLPTGNTSSDFYGGNRKGVDDYYSSSVVALKGDTGAEVPLGTLEEMAPWPLSRIKGAPSVGGPSVSAGGITFIAATPDYYLRAFDTANGAELWKAKLPTGGHATPTIYRAPGDERQFVVIDAGGHFGMPQESKGDYLIAFALPKKPEGGTHP